MVVVAAGDRRAAVVAADIRGARTVVVVPGGATAHVTGDPGALADADVIVAADEDALAWMERAWARGRAPGAAVLALVAGNDALARLARLGARGAGALPPHASPEQVAAAIGAVRAGLLVQVPSSAVSPPAPAADARARSAMEIEPLTGRERDVLALLALGARNRTIAQRLGISEHTVKFHLASILGKLGASTRTQAVREAMRRGLVTM